MHELGIIVFMTSRHCRYLPQFLYDRYRFECLQSMYCSNVCSMETLLTQFLIVPLILSCYACSLQMVQSSLYTQCNDIARYNNWVDFLFNSLRVGGLLDISYIFFPALLTSHSGPLIIVIILCC